MINDRRLGFLAVLGLFASLPLSVARGQSATTAPSQTIANELKRAFESQVKSTIDELHKEQVQFETRTRQKTVQRLVEQYYTERYCYRGRWYTRLCKRLIPVFETVQENYTVQVSLIAEKSVLTQPNAANVGEAYGIVPLEGLPASAGGRASKIFNTIDRMDLVKAKLVSKTSNIDRNLAAQTTGFAATADPNVEQVLGITAVVQGSDNQVVLRITVEQRDKASGRASFEKAKLNAAADAILNSIKLRIKQ